MIYREVNQGHFSSTPLSRCPAHALKGDDFRNLFGPAKPEDQFRGYGSDTVQILLKLANCMVESTPPEEVPETSCIPAGFTYLAQFAAHDLVQNATPLARHRDTNRDRTDLRRQRLMLETVYGGGPGDNQAAYALNSWDGGQRTRLRLLDVTKFDGERGDQESEFRDLPRVTIRGLNDNNGDDGLESFLADVLIEDLRNDDNLIIAQLTVVFHLLHNALNDYLDHDDRLPGHDNAAKRLQIVRKLTTLLYRRVVMDEMLGKLLHASVHKFYRNDHGRLDRSGDRRMALEFSHGAYRVGHAMVRETYRLNEDSREPEKLLSEILERTSARNPVMDFVPHIGEWLISWSSFFEIDGDRPPQMSRSLTPSIARGLDSTQSSPKDGQTKELLIYRDLLRGAFSGLRSVRSLARIIRKELPDAINNRAPFLCESHYKSRVFNWLHRNRNVVRDQELTSDEIERIAGDPPLIFLVMLEAEESQNGQCLGVLGSTIIAEIFFNAFDEGGQAIENEQEVAANANEIFNNKIPTTMSELISFVSGRVGPTEMSPPFV